MTYRCSHHFEALSWQSAYAQQKKHFRLQPTSNRGFVTSANLGYISDVIIIVISATVVMASYMAGYDAVSLGFKPVGEIQNP